MKFLRDPLMLFLLLGLGIYAAAIAFEAPEISYDIEIREADVKRLADQWNMQMRRAPTAAELNGLLEQFIREEIYYREAQRLNLDVNDTIVRRRMVQKLTFLTEDIATATALSEDELRQHYTENAESYQVPTRYSFRHRYFSADRRTSAEADARAALEDADIVGDPFMLQRAYAQRSEREIGDLFGREFAAGLAQLTAGESWQGPIKSAYGWHAVLLTEVEATRLPAFEEIAARVEVDAQQARRQAANTAYYDDLRALYQISNVDADGNATPFDG